MGRRGGRVSINGAQRAFRGALDSRPRAKTRGNSDLPLHFFTIVLNGEPFIRYHLDVFRELPFRWHWHVVEGAALLVHDTGWSVAGGGRLDSSLHDDGLSMDGTTGYLDEVAAAEPERISIYRKPRGVLWDGKLEMISAPLASIHEECLLWEVDADELWTTEQIIAMRRLFAQQPSRTAAYYWCQYFVGPHAVVTTRYNFAANPSFEWLRTWRFRPGDRWDRHEPPILVRPQRLADVDLGKQRPFLHDETEEAGAVFQHFAYATEEQVRFKEVYYGYGGAVESWRRLQKAVRSAEGPVRLGDYLLWVEDDALVDDPGRRRVPLLACEADGRWVFGSIEPRSTSRGPRPATDGSIVVDGVFFQHFSNTGIARVWSSLFDEWLKSGFARRVVFLDRGGAGPRLPGLTTRSVPQWRTEETAEDSLRLQRICDEEGAVLFVSTYYTTPIGTPSLMLVHDLIPERLRLDMSDPIWDEKRLTIEHASAYVCVSENTRRDLLQLEPTTRDKEADVVPLGVSGVFRPATDAEVAGFRRKHGLQHSYFLLVGDRRGVDGYKNTELLFRALRDWPDAATHEVVCVGGQPIIEAELKAIAPRVRTRRLALSDEELRLAYAGAEALVYPSRYEGFGLPVAEAMACGCPVVTTRVASLPEVAGDAAIYIDPDNADSLRRALEAVRDPSRRAALIAAGMSRAEALGWDRAAAALASLLSSAAAGDTAAGRRAREAVWGPRRHAQACRERAVAASRPPNVLVRQPRVVPYRLKTLARRYLPQWAIRLLRMSRAFVRRASSHRARIG